MHVGIISSTPLPPSEGIGSYVWNLATHLKQMGHKATIITRGSRHRTSLRLVDGVSIWSPTFLPLYPLHVHWHSLYLNKLVRQIEPLIDLFHLHTPLVPSLKTDRPQLVTVHTPMKSDIGSITERDFYSRLIKMQGTVSYQLEQDLFEKADKLTAVSNSVAHELNEYGIDPAEVNVLGNGVDTHIFKPAAKKQTSGRPYLFTAARLAPRKGLRDLIACAEIVCQQFPEHQFLIAGSGPREAELRAEIERRTLQKNVILLGYMGDKKRLVKLYQQADAYIHPAHYEGLPTVLLEAMACGIPAITTAVSGSLDVIDDGVNGLLAPARQPETLANAIIRILSDSAFAAKLGKAGLATISERYAWNVVSQNYVNEYEQLLASA